MLGLGRFLVAEVEVAVSHSLGPLIRSFARTDRSGLRLIVGLLVHMTKNLYLTEQRRSGRSSVVATFFETWIVRRARRNRTTLMVLGFVRSSTGRPVG